MTNPPDPSEVLNVVQEAISHTKKNSLRISKPIKEITASVACSIQAVKYKEMTGKMTTYNFQTGMLNKNQRRFGLWFTSQYNSFNNTIYFVVKVDEWVIYGNTL